MRMLRFVIVLWACGCGPSTGKPLHTFPSRQDLAELAAGKQAKQPLAVNEVSPEQWQLELPDPASPNPAHSLLAMLTPHAKVSPALDCVAHEFARLMAQADGKPPSTNLRRFISARCGALLAAPRFQSWMSARQTDTSTDAIVAQLKQKVHDAVDASAQLAGIGLARADGKVAVVVVFGTPEVELHAFERVVSEDGVLQVRGRVLFDTESLQAYVNAGEYRVRPCELDPAVAAPEFALRCQLESGDDAAWVQLMATPRGRVLAQEVWSVLALRSSEAAAQYSPRRSGAAHPVSEVADFQAALLELLNGIRQQAGLAPLALARKQCEVASSVTPAFFSALLSASETAHDSVDGITLGLMAGWDVRGGIIREGNVTANLIVDSLDAERWLSDALERPSGRVVLLDPEARVLALGATVQPQPSVLAALALTYRFFEAEQRPGARALHVLERLGRVRKARGLGRTVLVRDAPGMQEQLARITRGEAAPSDALRAAMQQTASELGRPAQGFVWETHDLDTIEFPSELLQKGDLTLGAGVTYYRAPGGAWGQYTVLFVVIRPSSTEV